jgi:ubiquinone/menaquinone biosynthesis C-methylase UbiE
MIAVNREPAPRIAMSLHPMLERVLQCPNCLDGQFDLAASERCSRCGYAVKTHDDILDFVDESTLSDHERAELRAQHHAVEEYYENENRLACQWDRISADELPPFLGWPSGLVLDLGCGTATAGAAFRRSGATVFGADLSLSCLQQARRRLDAVVRADAARLPFHDGVFDAVVARGALHHMDDVGPSLKEVSRVLKPGARALFLDPREFKLLEPIKKLLRKKDDSFTDDHHAFNLDEYVALIGESFEIEAVHTIHPVGIAIAVGLDHFPLPSRLPRRLLAETLYRLDQKLDATPLRKLGHLAVVVARHR